MMDSDLMTQCQFSKELEFEKWWNRPYPPLKAPIGFLTLTGVVGATTGPSTTTFWKAVRDVENARRCSVARRSDILCRSVRRCDDGRQVIFGFGGLMSFSWYGTNWFKVVWVVYGWSASYSDGWQNTKVCLWGKNEWMWWCGDCIAWECSNYLIKGWEEKHSYAGRAAVVQNGKRCDGQTNETTTKVKLHSFSSITDAFFGQISVW